MRFYPAQPFILILLLDQPLLPPPVRVLFTLICCLARPFDSIPDSPASCCPCPDGRRPFRRPCAAPSGSTGVGLPFFRQIHQSLLPRSHVRTLSEKESKYESGIRRRRKSSNQPIASSFTLVGSLRSRGRDKSGSNGCAVSQLNTSPRRPTSGSCFLPLGHRMDGMVKRV